MNEANKETQSIMSRFLPKKICISEELSAALSGFEITKNKLKSIKERCSAQIQTSIVEKQDAEIQFAKAVEAANAKELEAVDAQQSIDRSITAINNILGIVE